jgi:hypothetical protein
MAKGSTTNFPEQNVERAMLAANYEMDWMREIAEQASTRVGPSSKNFSQLAARRSTLSTAKHAKSASGRCRLQQKRSTAII